MWKFDSGLLIARSKPELIDGENDCLLMTGPDAAERCAGIRGSRLGRAEGSGTGISPNNETGCDTLGKRARAPSKSALAGFSLCPAGLVWLRNVYVASPISIPGLTPERDGSDMTRLPKAGSLLRCLCLLFSLMATSGLCVACVRRRPHPPPTVHARTCTHTPTKPGMCAKSNTRQRTEVWNGVMRGIPTPPCSLEPPPPTHSHTSEERESEEGKAPPPFFFSPKGHQSKTDCEIS